MAQSTPPSLQALPLGVATLLSQFIEAAINACGPDLVSIVLYGSGAEAKLARTSDVNLLVIVRAFDRGKANRLQNMLLAAEAAIRLRVMFLLEDEISSAVELFAQKFADILRRHKILYGSDVLSGMRIPRDDQVFRLRQVLLNLTLRIRELSVSRGDNPGRILQVMSDSVGPLRAVAMTLLTLEGQAASDADSALQSVAASLGHSATVDKLFAAHQQTLSNGDVQGCLFALLDFLKQLSQRADRLSGGQL